MKKVMKKIQFLIVSAIFMAGCATSQQVPSSADTQSAMSADRYAMAEQMLTWNLADKIFNHNVSPTWIDNSNFWYGVTTRQGREFFLVDAVAETHEAAFSQERLAEIISEETENEVSAYSIRMQNLEFETPDVFRFEAYGHTFVCDREPLACEVTEGTKSRVRASVASPNGRYDAFIREYNIWVKDHETGDEKQLTTEGEKYYGFGTNNQGWMRSDTPVLAWSPDSRKIATFRLDERGVEKMVLWRTKEGRPEADIWPYALPGDTIVPMMERVVLDVHEASKVWLDVEPDHQRTSNCCGLTRGAEWADIQFNEDASQLAFVSTSRDYKTVTLRIADTKTGAVRDIYSETAEPFFESNLTSRGVPNWRVLFDRDEFLWYTRKDNWGHLYLHDLHTAELINRVTEGDWNVVDIYKIDEENGLIWFTAVGIMEDKDPYQEYFYRSQLDGNNLTLLSDEKGNNQVWLSPDASFFVNTWSDFQNPQTSAFRNADGELVAILQEADISDLEATGWSAPIPFSAKARDGETDIYGVMYLPSDFDPEKTYPIVNNIYPGPQVGSIGTRSFSIFRRGQVQALAELGFVVVQIDAFGTPMRSRDFHGYYYGDMADNGLPDQISAMKELAERYDFIDIDRAGMYGHSGGGFATAAAMFRHPEFFKVGVASAGNHDNRGYTFYWGEKFQGLLEETEDGDTYTNQAVHLMAENLEGKLLISYGTMDTNVHPAMTLLVIDELIRHNKDFDVMVMPNRGHGFANEPYKIRRTWDYFTKHLMGVTPPDAYLIGR